MAEIPFSQQLTNEERLEIREKIIKLYRDDLVEPKEISKQLNVPRSYIKSVTRNILIGPRIKYKYEVISKSEAFIEFKEYIDSGKLVVIGDWYEKLGFNNPISFSGFMKKHNIDFKLKVFANVFSEAQILIMKDEYNDSNLSIEEICEKYDISPQTLYRLIGKNGDTTKGFKRRGKFNTAKKSIENGLDFSNSNHGKARDLLKSKNIKFEVLNDEARPIFLIQCSVCSKELKCKPENVLAHVTIETENKFYCQNCFNEYLASQYRSAMPICEKRNTTGYIGVSPYRKKGGYLGYLIQIVYKKIHLVSKCFPDKLLSDKTLMEAVVYREKYIIENDLPHTRNLSNEELILNMEMLGQYGDIDLIKKRLGI